MNEKTRILVVDDETDQLQTIQRGLFLLGIDCLTARSSSEALSHLVGPVGERINLLLTDLTMPGRSGAELVEMARELRPALPVMVITGLALTSEVAALRGKGIPILRKPFTPDQLGRAIAKLLTTNERTRANSKVGEST